MMLVALKMKNYDVFGGNIWSRVITIVAHISKIMVTTRDDISVI